MINLEEEKKKKVEKKYTAGNIATETAPTVIKGDKPLTIEEALVEILNKLEKIEKKIDTAL